MKKYSCLFLVAFCLCSCSEINSLPESPDENEEEMKPGPNENQGGFRHPGITLTFDDMERICKQVENKVEPVYSAFQILSNHPYASSSYQMKGPLEVISAGSGLPDQNKHESDFSAAYCNALMWVISKDEKYAAKALDIIWQYSTVLDHVDVRKNIILVNGFASFQVAKTMEILRYTYDIPKEKLLSINNMIEKKFLPHMIKDLSAAPYHIGNQDAVGCRGIMGCAIYLDNRELYDWAKKFYLTSDHNGCVKNYVHPVTGQCQESGRDQIHCQLGLGTMAEICEIAYKQGDDLYSAYDNLLLKGFEYTSKYNSGLSVPFDVMSDVTGRPDWAYKKISSSGRGQCLPFYEYVLNHYSFRKGLKHETEMTNYLLTEGNARPQTFLNKSDLQFIFSSLTCYKAK